MMHCRHHLTFAFISLRSMIYERDVSMDSFDLGDIGEMRERRQLSAFTFLDESMDNLDLASAKGDDTEYNFSESESNVETADPEEFDLILPKEDHRKSAANMGALWGSVLAPSASEIYSRHSRSSTSTEDIDLGAHQSRRLLTEATFVRQMVPRSVSAPEIDFQLRSRQARAAKGPYRPHPSKQAVSLNNATASAGNDQPRKESSDAGAVGETPPLLGLGLQSDPPLSLE
jgi:hypothetical protein